MLKVAGDLDIGDDVDIEEGFEANGWIVIRNPMPTIAFLFIYLKQLLLIGEDGAAESLVAELMETDADANADAESAAETLVIPRSATVNDDAWRVSTPATTGDDCRLHGNLRAEQITVGSRNNIFGSLRARGDIAVDPETKVHGDVTSREGAVRLGTDVRVLGDISCTDLELGPGAEVDGTIRASGEITMATSERDLE